MQFGINEFIWFAGTRLERTDIHAGFDCLGDGA